MYNASYIRCCDCGKNYQFDFLEDEHGQLYLQCPHCGAVHTADFDKVDNVKLVQVKPKKEIKLLDYWINTHGHSRIYSGDGLWTALAGEDADVSDHAIGDPIIVCIQFYYGGSCNKTTEGEVLKLQWESSLDPGVWTDVGATTEIDHSVTGVVTDDGTGTDRVTTDPSAGACSTGYNTNYENEGDNTLPDAESIVVINETWSTAHWVLGTSNAASLAQYSFRILNVTNSNAVLAGTVAAQITMAASSSSSSESSSSSSSESSSSSKRLRVKL